MAKGSVLIVVSLYRCIVVSLYRLYHKAFWAQKANANTERASNQVREALERASNTLATRPV